jgi:hypothetical protein
MHWVTADASIACGHDGVVERAPSQHWVTIDGGPVLVDDDPQGRHVAGCPNIGPSIKPCVTTLRVQRGYSDWITVGGRRVVLSNLDGLTDGTVPGTVHYTVRRPGQQHVSADR